MIYAFKIHIFQQAGYKNQELSLIGFLMAQREKSTTLFI